MRSKNTFRFPASRTIGFFAGTVFIIALALFARPARSPQWKGTVSREGEVVVVRNPGTPVRENTVLTLKEDLSIGGASAPEESAFAQIRSVVVDKEENIYVLDGRNVQIRVFSKEGRFLRTIGKKGQGPGELNGALCLSLNPAAGELMIQDLGNRLAYFSLNGTFLRAGFVRDQIGQSKIRVDPAGNLVVFGGIPGTPGSHFTANKEFQLKKLSAEGKIIGIVGIFPGQGDLSAYDPALTVHWDIDIQGNIVFGYPADYEIRVFGAGNGIIKRISRKFKPAPMTSEDKARIVRAIPPQTMKTLKIEIAGERVAFGGLIADDEGRIFIQSWEQGENGTLFNDIFNAEGRYFGRVPIRPTPVLIRKQKLYSIEEDVDGAPVVKRYLLQWTGESKR